jgi:hypothetical protein
MELTGCNVLPANTTPPQHKKMVDTNTAAQPLAQGAASCTYPAAAEGVRRRHVVLMFRCKSTHSGGERDTVQIEQTGAATRTYTMGPARSTAGQQGSTSNSNQKMQRTSPKRSHAPGSKNRSASGRRLPAASTGRGQRQPTESTNSRISTATCKARGVTAQRTTARRICTPPGPVCQQAATN